MFRNLFLKIATGVILGCLIISGAVISPARAMIFPDLLSLVRADDNRDTAKDAATKKAATKEAAATAEKHEKAAAEEAYVVKTGDTLWELSRRYCVDWKKICYANNLGLNGVIRPGQKLTIPIGEMTFHIVKAGENLWEISRKYDKDVTALAAANDIANTNRLRAGMRLIIPEGDGAVAAFSSRQHLPSRYEGHWAWPIKGPVTSNYGPRGDEFHHGLDIAADKGDKVFAIREGRVEFSGWLNYIYGNAVIIDHGDGIRSLYGHNSKILVKEGDQVKASTIISRVGSSGRSTGFHMHLEIYVDGQTVDPQKFLE